MRIQHTRPIPCCVRSYPKVPLQIGLTQFGMNKADVRALGGSRTAPTTGRCFRAPLFYCVTPTQRRIKQPLLTLAYFALHFAIFAFPFVMFVIPFAAKAQPTSLPAIPDPRPPAAHQHTNTPTIPQTSAPSLKSSILPPVGTLCTTRIETQIYAPTPPTLSKLPSHRPTPPAHNTPRLHIRATYQMAVVSSDAAGYIVEGQTTEYTPLRVMGHPPNNTLKGLLSVYVGAMWRVHLDASNTVRSIHYGHPTEHTNKHKKSTERAIQLIFLRWPAPPHRPLRRWRNQHTTRQSGSFPCTETHSLQYKLNRRKGPRLTLQSTLRQHTRCSDTKRTLQSQSAYQGTVHLTYQRLQQRAHWRGIQSDTLTTHTQPTPAHTNARPIRIDVHTTCTP